jgi:hypothetical protein
VICQDSNPRIQLGKRFEADCIVPGYRLFVLVSLGFFERRCCALLRRIAPCCVFF